MSANPISDMAKALGWIATEDDVGDRYEVMAPAWRKPNGQLVVCEHGWCVPSEALVELFRPRWTIAKPDDRATWPPLFDYIVYEWLAEGRMPIRGVAFVESLGKDRIRFALFREFDRQLSAFPLDQSFVDGPNWTLRWCPWTAVEAKP